MVNKAVQVSRHARKSWLQCLDTNGMAKFKCCPPFDVDYETYRIKVQPFTNVC